jgi:hypothetical protein
VLKIYKTLLLILSFKALLNHLHHLKFVLIKSFKPLFAYLKINITNGFKLSVIQAIKYRLVSYNSTYAEQGDS